MSSSARTLASLTLGDVREHRDLVLSWLRSLVVAQPALEAAYSTNPRHVLMARMGHLAQDLGNTRLADQIERLLTAHHRHQKSRTHTGVGDEIVVPADTYHSTTIEGYRITREEVRAVLEGVPYEGRTQDEIARLMALKGYSQAFDQTLDLVRETFGGQKLSEGMIFDLHLELWGPSIDAGIVEAADMRGWRESPVFIRRSRYVPPGPEKVGRYMAQLVEQVNGLEVGPITRAACTHWGFVHIHPFMDGNGRLARLLMNYMLAASGFPWTTIRAEERPVYFQALEQAHIDDDFAPLAELLRDDVMRSWELLS